MAKKILPLSALKVKTAKPTEKAQNLFDGGGLYLHIPPARYDAEGRMLPASKWWRLKYRFQGKPCMISLGVYPDVSLEEARARRQEAREMVARGINPSAERRRVVAEKSLEQEVQENTVAKVAMDWFDVAKTEWSDGHARTVLSRMQRDIFPKLGACRISEVTTTDVLEALRIVEDRKAYETAHRIRTIIGQIWTYALITKVPGVTSNPAFGLSKAMKRPATRNMAAILDPQELGRLLRDIDGYAGSYVVKCALRLTPMLFVRPGELRAARWADMYLDASEWRIPVEAMKSLMAEKSAKRGQVHVVPLSRQAVEILRSLYSYTGSGQYVFPGRSQTRCMSENAVLAALRTMGWDADTVTPHGFRATARTMLHETLGFSPDAIEAQLGHRVPDRLGDAYNRAKHLEERRRMMQAWADFLEGLKCIDIVAL